MQSVRSGLWFVGALTCADAAVAAISGWPRVPWCCESTGVVALATSTPGYKSSAVQGTAATLSRGGASLCCAAQWPLLQSSISLPWPAALPVAGVEFKSLAGVDGVGEGGRNRVSGGCGMTCRACHFTQHACGSVSCWSATLCRRCSGQCCSRCLLSLWVTNAAQHCISYTAMSRLVAVPSWVL